MQDSQNDKTNIRMIKSYNIWKAESWRDTLKFAKYIIYIYVVSNIGIGTRLSTANSMVVLQYTRTELLQLAKAGKYFVAVVLVLADKKITLAWDLFYLCLKATWVYYFHLLFHEFWPSITLSVPEEHGDVREKKTRT